MKIKIALVSVLMCIVQFGFAGVQIKYGVSTYQNKRPYQEDRFAYAKVDKGYFFGVYDGHGGDKTSSLLCNKLHGYFASEKGSLEKRLRYAFEKADYISQNSFSDGSTALAVFIDNNNVMHCAWAGDTRAVLEKSGKVSFATQDHKPDRADEKKRIERAGGNIFKYGVWRINGLAVSRSIGDVDCKLQQIGCIISDPEYALVQLDANNHFLILASDGVWDVIANNDAVTMVQDGLRSGKSLDAIAKIVQDAAIKKGSNDNITVCVVQFNWSPISTTRKWWNWLWNK